MRIDSEPIRCRFIRDTPDTKPGRRILDVDGAWRPIRARAGLHDVRIRDVRHGFASRAPALGGGCRSSACRSVTAG